MTGDRGKGEGREGERDMGLIRRRKKLQEMK